MSLKGRIALVTGGTGALGSVVVKRLLKEGARVFSTYMPSHPPKTAPKDVTLIECDAGDERSVESAFAEILRSGGTLDIVVNTIGGFTAGGPVDSLSTKDWDLMMNLNLRTAFLITKQTLRVMKGGAYGRIIHISAQTALRPQPGKAAYAISKSGVIMLTQISALETAGTGITINAVAPSIIDTPQNRIDMPNDDRARWVTPEAIAERIVGLCSLEEGGVTGSVIPMPEKQ